MMADKIPDEIMREARRLAISLNGFAISEDFERIARAMMARDKRAADIVAGLSWQIDLSPDHVRARKPSEYAAAILTYGGSDEQR